MAAGPDGSIWFTETSSARLGRVDRQGMITEWPVPTAGSQPYGIAVGADGAMWFTEFAAGRIGRAATSPRGLPRFIDFRFGIPGRAGLRWAK